MWNAAYWKESRDGTNNAIEETGENTKTSTFKIQNKFKQPVDHETFGVAPYNPFIFLHQNTDKNRTEVHLVNHGPTSKENMDLFNTQQDLSDKDKGIYYVSDQNYPFAIHLSDVESFSTTEKEAIDKSFLCYRTRGCPKIRQPLVLWF